MASVAVTCFINLLFICRETSLSCVTPRGGCFHCLGRYPEMVGRSSRKSFASYLGTSFLLLFRATELRRRKNEIRKATNPGSCWTQSPSYYRLYFLVSKRGRLSLLCLSHLARKSPPTCGTTRLPVSPGTAVRSSGKRLIFFLNRGHRCYARCQNQ
jgi:hypothetical protein